MVGLITWDIVVVSLPLWVMSYFFASIVLLLALGVLKSCFCGKNFTETEQSFEKSLLKGKITFLVILCSLGYSASCLYLASEPIWNSLFKPHRRNLENQLWASAFLMIAASSIGIHFKSNLRDVVIGSGESANRTQADDERTKPQSAQMQQQFPLFFRKNENNLFKKVKRGAAELETLDSANFRFNQAVIELSQKGELDFKKNRRSSISKSTKSRSLQNLEDSNQSQAPLEIMNPEHLFAFETPEKAKRVRVSSFSFTDLENAHIQRRKFSAEGSIPAENCDDIFGKEPIETSKHLDDGLCCVCRAQPVDCVIVACGHGHFCTDCVKSMAKLDQGCPLCRTMIEKFVGVRPVEGTDIYQTVDFYMNAEVKK